MTDYSLYTDQELTELLRNGDRMAYTEIYHRYKRLLYQFAFKRLGNKEEVSDIIHELFLTLWERHADINLTYSLSTYLHSSVRNRIINHIAHREVSSRYIDSFNQYAITWSSTADHLVRDKQLRDLIEKEIGALPPKMRQVFELSRKTGYNRKEIAEELKLSEQTVKSHMQHALKILKMKLGTLLILVFYIYL